MDLTYEQVSKYLVEADVDGNQVICTFRKENGDLIQSSATIRRLNTVQSQITRRVKTVVINRTRSKAASMVRSVLGGGILGATASTIIRTVSNPGNLGTQFSEEEEEAAVVTAFEMVQSHFPTEAPKIVLRQTGNKPAPPPAVKENLSPFEMQVKKAPLQNLFEKEILARILVETANVDGEIEAEESALLEEIIAPEVGTIQQLLVKDPVSTVECRELNPKSKETIYMAAWMMALSNLDISASEESLLYEYAEMFALPRQSTEELIKNARFSILENAIEPTTDRATLFELADKLKMNREDAEVCLIQMKKRL